MRSYFYPAGLALLAALLFGTNAPFSKILQDNPPVTGWHTHEHTHEPCDHTHWHTPDIHHTHTHNSPERGKS